MMDLAAAHAGFVIAAYAISAVFLSVLLAAVMLRRRRLSKEEQKLKPGGDGK